jgi:glycerol kinase
LNYYLAIDQGTHASRACLFDEAGCLVDEHVKEIALHRISHSHIEQDAEEIVRSVIEVVQKLIDDLKNDLKDNPNNETSEPAVIVSCGIAIQRSSVLAWRKDGTALSPVLSWQDTRGADQLEELKPAESEIQRLSGLPLSAHYGASKMHYLLNSAACKDIPREELRLSPLISYLLFHLFDEHPYIVDHTNAQRTQLFDLDTLDWSEKLSELFHIPVSTLPQCTPALSMRISPHGTLLDTGIPVTAICGDQNAAVFGAGALPDDSALVNFGSGAFILTLLKHYRESNRLLNTIAFSEQGEVRYAREGTVNGAGSALDWLEDRHGTSDIWQQLPAWLDEIEHPPIFINTIGGLGSPWWNRDIDAEFMSTADRSGNDGQHSSIPELPAQAVAVIESIVFMVCSNLEIIQHEQSVSDLRVSGGLSRLDGLCQKLADLSGLTVKRVDIKETTARGVAWLAAGQPEHWSDATSEIFSPVDAGSLKERYTLFYKRLDELLRE